MNDRTTEQALGDLWRSQGSDAPTMTLELVRHRAAEHAGRIRRTNTLQWVTIAVAVGLLLWHVWQTPMLSVRLALLLIVAFVIYTSIKWYRQAAVRPAPDEAGVFPALAHYREQLERQRRARKADPCLWLGGLLAAAAFDVLLMYAADRPWSALRFLIMMGVTTFSLGIYGWFEARERRRLEREIQALDSLK